MFFILVVLAVIALALVVWLLGPPVLGKSLKTDEQQVERLRRSSSALHYRVPDGQDPAVLTSALAEAGYQARADLAEGHHVLMVDQQGGGSVDPHEVRQVIEGADASSLEGGEMSRRVVFEEER